MKRTIKYSMPVILGSLLSSFIYNGKENYSMSWNMLIASIIGGLFAGFLLSKLNKKSSKNES